MGTLTPVLQYASLIKGGADMISGAAGNEAAYRESANSQALALKQLKQTQAEHLRQMQENAAREREKIAANASAAETERRAALKRAVARQRAAYGASGIGNQLDGSNEAVLLGLFSESDSERAAREKLDTLRTAALDQDITQQKRLNVLQASQLKEKQKLDDLSSGIGRASNVIDAVAGFGSLFG